MQSGVQQRDSEGRPIGVDRVVTDARLAAAGDLGAFERLHRATVGRVYGVLRRLVGPEEAEEATQEAYVQAWIRLPDWRGEARFETWLHRVAVNAAVRGRRRAGIRRDHEADHAGTRAPVAPAPGSDERMDLEAALGKLPERAAQVFVLHDAEGWTHAEIGEALGVSAGTSKSQLHRARMLLRETLGDRESQA